MESMATDNVPAAWLVLTGLVAGNGLGLVLNDDMTASQVDNACLPGTVLGGG